MPRALGRVAARTSAVSQGCCVAQHTPAQSYRAWLCALRLVSQDLCHDTICCIVTQHQKWAVAHSSSTAPFFFFSFSFIFFFHLFYSLQDHKKKKKLFISSIEPKIFTIIFFSYFTLCKTPEKKKFLNIFPICYLPSIQFHTIHTTHNQASIIKMHNDFMI